MDKEKQLILDAANQYTEYITKNIPQTHNDEVRYYFSGSIAMLLIMGAKSFLRGTVAGKKFKPRGENIEIDPSSQTCLEQGIRASSSGDVDVVEIEDDYFLGFSSIYNTKRVRQNCSLTKTLFPTWREYLNGSIYLDLLNDDRKINAHNIACITLKDGTKVYTIDPVDLIFHKFADAISALRTSENAKAKGGDEYSDKKYKKDIKDFCSLVNGILPLIKDFDVSATLDEILTNNEQSAIKSLIEGKDEESARKFYQDCKPHIKSGNEQLFKKLFEEILNRFALVKSL